MTSFSKKAKAEAAKYKHQINPKARHKYTFASDCGAGKQGSKGFQPGNTCGGDGDGKNDAGDQGGGDKAPITTAYDKLVEASGEWENKGTGREKFDNAFNEFMDTVEKENPRMHEAIIEEMDNMGGLPASALPDVLANTWMEEVIEEGRIADTPASADALESDADAPSTEQIMEDMRNQQAELDAEIARLTQQNAEQKSAADADIAEAYKDVTEEDIQDMLDEKDITAADAEEMRGYVAQAQAAQADAPAADDAGDVRPVKPSSNVMSDGTHAIDHQAYQDYVSELSDEELSYIRIDARESMQANPDGLKAGYYADEVNYVEMEMAERMKDSAQADAPAAEGETMEAMERRRAELNDTSAADEVVETLELDTMETSQWERLKKTAEEAAPTGQRGYLTPEDMRSGGVIDKLIDAGALRHTGSGYYEIAEDLSAAKREMEDSRARQRDEDEAADAGDVSALSESELEEVLGPRAAAPEAQGDAPEAQGVETDWDSVQTGGKYEGVYPQGYKVDHAGSGERPWVVSDPSGDTYDFADESNAEVAAITLGLAADGQLQGDMAEDSPEAFAAFVVDHNGEYRDTTADKINDLSARFDDAYIGKYEGGITEYARQHIDDMGGPSEAVQNISSYSDYTKWNTELKNADEGYGYREADGGYEVYDRQESDVEAWNPEEDQVPTYSSLYEAEKAAEEMNNDLLDEMMSESTAKHPGSGESYANRYFDFQQYARDLELGGDIIDLGDGELIFGNY